MTTHLQGLLQEETQLDKSSQLSSVVVSLSDMMQMTSGNKYNKEFLINNQLKYLRNSKNFVSIKF